MLSLSYAVFFKGRVSHQENSQVPVGYRRELKVLQTLFVCELHQRSNNTVVAAFEQNLNMYFCFSSDFHVFWLNWIKE